MVSGFSTLTAPVCETGAVFFYYLLFFFGVPNIDFQRILCAFFFLPDFVVGMPVAVAIFLFALVIPSARFQLKPPNDIIMPPELYILPIRCGVATLILIFHRKHIVSQRF